jgi:hypothetical protein
MVWTAKTGELQSVFIPFVTSPLKDTDSAFAILKTAVVGSILQNVFRGGGLGRSTGLVASAPEARIGRSADAPALNVDPLPPELQDLEGAFNAPIPTQDPAEVRIQDMDVRTRSARVAAAPERGSYEARVLHGIWATAPYLHNGSVPTLAELLKPPAQRVSQFKVGSAYDTDNVGLAAVQTKFDYEMRTSDCSDLNSGNSRCGHPYGTNLPPEEKKALLEYLKTL